MQYNAPSPSKQAPNAQPNAQQPVVTLSPLAAASSRKLPAIGAPDTQQGSAYVVSTGQQAMKQEKPGLLGRIKGFKERLSLKQQVFGVAAALVVVLMVVVGAVVGSSSGGGGGDSRNALTYSLEVNNLAPTEVFDPTVAGVLFIAMNATAPPFVSRMEFVTITPSASAGSIVKYSLIFNSPAERTAGELYVAAADWTAAQTALQTSLAGLVFAGAISLSADASTITFAGLPTAEVVFLAETATPTPTISVTPSITPSSTPTISVTPSTSVSASATVSDSSTASTTATHTPSVSLSPTSSISHSSSSSLTSSVSITPTPSTSLSATPTISVTPTISDTPTISVTPSITPTASPPPRLSGIAVVTDPLKFASTYTNTLSSFIQTNFPASHSTISSMPTTSAAWTTALDGVGTLIIPAMGVAISISDETRTSLTDFIASSGRIVFAGSFNFHSTNYMANLLSYTAQTSTVTCPATSTKQAAATAMFPGSSTIPATLTAPADGDTVTCYDKPTDGGAVDLYSGGTAWKIDHSRGSITFLARLYASAPAASADGWNEILSVLSSE